MLGKLSSAVLTLYRGSRELPMEEFQDWAFEYLRTVLDFDSGLWLTAILHLDQDTATFHTRHLYKQPLQLLVDWAQCEDATIFSRRVFASPGTTLACTPSVEMGVELAAHARRYGIEQILATTQIDPIAGISELISVYRADVDRPFSEDERVFQQHIVPHLSEAWRLCRIRHLEHLIQPACALDAHTAGADMEGVLNLIDPGFTKLLRTEWPDWRGPRLPGKLLDSHRRGESLHIGRRTAFHFVPFDDHILLRARRKQPIDDLSQREREVARHYAAGLSHKKIAQSLGLSPATVRNHLSTVYLKLGVDNKAMLTAMVMQYA